MSEIVLTPVTLKSKNPKPNSEFSSLEVREFSITVVFGEREGSVGRFSAIRPASMP